MAIKKPLNMDVANFFSYLFTDDALISYNYSGANNVGEQKLPMRNYNIFTDCMIGRIFLVYTGVAFCTVFRYFVESIRQTGIACTHAVAKSLGCY